MKLPEINLKELERLKEQNFKERLEFQDRYVNWMKMTNNTKWSSAQKAIIDRKSGNPSHRNRSTIQKIRRVSKRHTKN